MFFSTSTSIANPTPSSAAGIKQNGMYVFLYLISLYIWPEGLWQRLDADWKTAAGILQLNVNHTPSQTTIGHTRADPLPPNSARQRIRRNKGGELLAPPPVLCQEPTPSPPLPSAPGCLSSSTSPSPVTGPSGLALGRGWRPALPAWWGSWPPPLGQLAGLPLRWARVDLRGVAPHSSCTWPPRVRTRGPA